jgi:hypothetical protein
MVLKLPRRVIVDNHQQRLRRVVRRQKVLDMQALQADIEGRSRRSLFRDLASVGYRTSFTHTGRYYTLSEIPDFDELGLWFRGEIGFSRVGTLKETAVVQVEGAPAGRTHAELSHVLRVRVHNTLLDLVRAGRIGREPYRDKLLYVSANTERAAEQVQRRVDNDHTLGEALRVPTDEEVIEVLVEALRGSRDVPEPLLVAKRLASRGVRLEPRHVERIFEAHRLVPGKKTVRRSSTPSRR